MDLNQDLADLRSFTDHCGTFSTLTDSPDEPNGFKRLPEHVNVPIRAMWDRGLAALSDYPQLVEDMERGRISRPCVSKLWWKLFSYFIRRCQANADGMDMPPSAPVVVRGETQVRGLSSWVLLGLGS